jgi:hypothetical protein
VNHPFAQTLVVVVVAGVRRHYKWKVRLMPTNADFRFRKEEHQRGALLDNA